MKPEDARRRAELLSSRGDHAGAARLYESGGLYFEAAEAFEAAGDAESALANLVRVGADHELYREACTRAIRFAYEGGEVSLAFENLVAAFVRRGPLTEPEDEAFYVLARLYERLGFQEEAAEALRKLTEVNPDFRDAASRLVALRSAASAELPDLPEGPLYEETLLAEQDEQGRVTPLSMDIVESQDAAPVFRPGVTISNRYRVEEKIGAGGMSVVFRATDIELGDAVALKVFTQAIHDEETNERLKRELRLSRQLIHPNVVRLYDMGFHLGFRYVSMELLEGMDLRDRLNAILPIAEGLSYLVQACAGLGEAHAKGIVHRDVKPENCFISRGGVLKVMDFGIAKLQSAPSVTATGIIAGTPAYMAPEQVMNFKKAGAPADIYSLGVVAYEMFTGSTPFSHAEAMPLLLMHVNDPPPPPRSRNPDLPLPLERAILKCLAKKPDQRFSSCAELAKELEAVRHKLPS